MLIILIDVNMRYSGLPLISGLLIQSLSLEVCVKVSLARSLKSPLKADPSESECQCDWLPLSRWCLTCRPLPPLYEGVCKWVNDTRKK